MLTSYIGQNIFRGVSFESYADKDWKFFDLFKSSAA